MDQPRYDTDLGHYCAVTGQLGRLTTLSAIPTVGGDTISIDMDVSARLTALRMPMVQDARMEFGIFHVKHRNVYGELWENLIKGGVLSVFIG
jgi:shikimate kinase